MREKLESSRMILRPLELSDSSRVKDLAGSVEIAKTTLHVPHPYLDGMAENWISSLIEERSKCSQFAYALILKESLELVGTCTIIVNEIDSIAELAYWIGFDYWNRGYGSEAATVLINEAFNTLKIEKVFAAHFGNNPSSGRLLEKIGMIREGILRKHIKKWNESIDLIYYGILKTEKT